MNGREAARFVRNLDDDQLTQVAQGVYPPNWLTFPHEWKRLLEQAARVLRGERHLLHEKRMRERKLRAVNVVNRLFTNDELMECIQGSEPAGWDELTPYSPDEIREAARVALGKRNATALVEAEAREELREAERKRAQRRDRERAEADHLAQQRFTQAITSLQGEPWPFIERMAAGIYPAEIGVRHESERAIWRQAAQSVLDQHHRRAEERRRIDDKVATPADAPEELARQRLALAITSLDKVALPVIEGMANGIYPAAIGVRQEIERAIWRQAASLVLAQRLVGGRAHAEDANATERMTPAPQSVTGRTSLNGPPAMGSESTYPHQLAKDTAGDGARSIPTVPPHASSPSFRPDRMIYHITHLANLPSILATRCLWSEAIVGEMGLQSVRIGYQHLKGRRMVKSVPPFDGHVVGDYVPFYFAPRSPMLYTISRGNVPGYGEGQAPIVHLRTSVAAVTVASPHWRFTEGNATSESTRFFDDLAHMGSIDWDVMASRYWNNTPEDTDRERRRQAEFLVRHSVPWALIQEIGVMNEAVAEWVRACVAAQSHRPAIIVRRDWYYEERP